MSLVPVVDEKNKCVHLREDYVSWSSSRWWWLILEGEGLKRHSVCKMNRAGWLAGGKAVGWGSEGKERGHGHFPC